jgi:hypothetical protein
VTQDDLVGLRVDLQYASQKIERRVFATLAAKHRENHPEKYSPDEIVAAQKEVEHSKTMLYGAVDKLLPALKALIEETVPV